MTIGSFTGNFIYNIAFYLFKFLKLLSELITMQVIGQPLIIWLSGGLILNALLLKIILSFTK